MNNMKKRIIRAGTIIVNIEVFPMFLEIFIIRSPLRYYLEGQCLQM
ncbi:MAG: hypothetical protein QXF21_00250 [Thermoproteota archaeon]